MAICPGSRSQAGHCGAPQFAGGGADESRPAENSECMAPNRDACEPVECGYLLLSRRPPRSQRGGFLVPEDSCGTAALHGREYRIEVGHLDLDNSIAEAVAGKTFGGDETPNCLVVYVEICSRFRDSEICGALGRVAPTCG
jgi:hypothetical protein